jgi:hypothetical protein
MPEQEIRLMEICMNEGELAARVTLFPARGSRLGLSLKCDRLDIAVVAAGKARVLAQKDWGAQLRNETHFLPLKFVALHVNGYS